MRTSHSVLAFTAAGIACWASVSSLGSDGSAARPAAVATLSRDEPEKPQPAADVAALKRELEDLRMRNDQLEGTLAEDRAVEPEAPTANEQPAVEPEETPEQARAREQREFAEYFGTLDRLREGQSVDRTWEDDVASRLRSLTRDGLAPDSTVEGIQCGTTLCRIEVSHGSEQARHLFARDLTRVVQSMTSIQWLENTSIVYIARGDEPLPAWPEST